MNLMVAIRSVAVFDLIVTGFLALPYTAHYFVRVIYALERHLSGSEALTSSMPVLPPVSWLFVNIGGVLGVLWAVVRIVMPMRSLALADAMARFVVAALISYYILIAPIPRVFLAFVATEILGTGIQLVALRSGGRPGRVSNGSILER